jgi:hypothetical protein
VIELPGAPTDVSFQDLAFSNNGPYDVLGDRDGIATIVICATTAVQAQILFSATSDPIDATIGMPLDDYTIVEISKPTRYMTIYADGADALVYWYIV